TASQSANSHLETVQHLPKPFKTQCTQCLSGKQNTAFQSAKSPFVAVPRATRGVALADDNALVKFPIKKAPCAKHKGPPLRKFTAKKSRPSWQSRHCPNEPKDSRL